MNSLTLCLLFKFTIADKQLSSQCAVDTNLVFPDFQISNGKGPHKFQQEIFILNFLHLLFILTLSYHFLLTSFLVKQ
jgi:hypothetical protein